MNFSSYLIKTKTDKAHTHTHTKLNNFHLLFCMKRMKGKKHSAVLCLITEKKKKTSSKQRFLKLGFSYGLNLPENEKREEHCRLVIFIFPIINRCFERPFFLYPLLRNQINIIYISKTGQIHFQNSFSCRSKMEKSNFCTVMSH